MSTKFWDKHKGWKEAEEAWEKQETEARLKSPLKVLKNYPKMVGITKETERFLKLKSFFWMVRKDEGLQVLKSVLKRPFYHLKNYIGSVFSKKSFIRAGDFFYYGISSEEEFKRLLIKPNTLLILGFSYCHKPFECPSGRFTDQCVHDLENPVCQQCFIGKSVHAAPTENTVAVYIPTVHHIGRAVFAQKELHPEKEIIFLITACEMTLKMFADWGNMAGIKGIGVRLDGRICNTMKAFELSERGIKPGLTVVLDETQNKCLEWIRLRRSKG